MGQISDLMVCLKFVRLHFPQDIVNTSPSRFSDFHRGDGDIKTNVLSLDLKENADQEVNVSEKTGFCTQTILV